MKERCEHIMYIVDIICFLFLLIVLMVTNHINVLQIVCLIVLFFNILLNNAPKKKYTGIELVKRFNEYKRWNRTITYPSLFSKDAVIALKKDTNKMNRLLNEMDKFCKNYGCQFVKAKKTNETNEQIN